MTLQNSGFLVFFPSWSQKGTYLTNLKFHQEGKIAERQVRLYDTPASSRLLQRRKKSPWSKLYWFCPSHFFRRKSGITIPFQTFPPLCRTTRKQKNLLRYKVHKGFDWNYKFSGEKRTNFGIARSWFAISLF